MADDVLLNKAAAIERSVRRAREEYGADEANLLAPPRPPSFLFSPPRARKKPGRAGVLLGVRRPGVPPGAPGGFPPLRAAGFLFPSPPAPP